MVRSQAVVEGLKGFPDCTDCQCYPEGRVDCLDHKGCRRRLRLQSKEERARDYAASVRARTPSMQVRRKEFPDEER